MHPRLKSFLPRGLLGRAALILVVPIVTIQLIVSIAFIQRHFEGVTRQLSRGVIDEIVLILNGVAQNPALPLSDTDAGALDEARRLGAAFSMTIDIPPAPLTATDRVAWDDLTGSIVITYLREGLADVRSVDLVERRGVVLLTIDTARGPLRFGIERARLSASNPHQLLVIMVVASGVMTLIAYAFLRNQMRPIARLADAAEAFGRGEILPYRPRGATEVRAAGAAFLDMRARIERSNEARRLMLSGISHDLRTPLTRLRLGLALVEDEAEAQALLSDVAEMERMVDEFLAFARSDALEEPEDADPAAIARRVAANAARAGHDIALSLPPKPLPGLRLRPQAVTRALENLVTNGLRYGQRVALSVELTPRHLVFVVEDDGPGIPADLRDRAIAPFARLDDARNRNRGDGAGLGLAIVSDIARSHGGALILAESAALGGLRAELRLAR
jgi:two-component system osmolarity sensor histidine kinase EnvZ